MSPNTSESIQKALKSLLGLHAKLKDQRRSFDSQMTLECVRIVLQEAAEKQCSKDKNRADV